MKPYPQGTTLTDNILNYQTGGFNEKAFQNIDNLNSGIEINSNIIKVKTEKSDRGLHPTQKPLKLMEFLIELTTKEGQVVVDPFCGCGTTLKAAKNLNRKYIGIEVNEEFYDIARKI